MRNTDKRLPVGFVCTIAAAALRHQHENTSADKQKDKQSANNRNHQRRHFFCFGLRTGLPVKAANLSTGPECIKIYLFDWPRSVGGHGRLHTSDSLPLSGNGKNKRILKFIHIVKAMHRLFFQSCKHDSLKIMRQIKLGTDFIKRRRRFGKMLGRGLDDILPFKWRLACQSFKNGYAK